MGTINLASADGKIFLVDTTDFSVTELSTLLPRTIQNIFGVLADGMYYLLCHDCVIEVELKIYNLTYTIKDGDGNVRYTITGAGPIRKSFISWNPQTKICGSFFRTLEHTIGESYQVEPPDGTTLAGYTLQQGSGRIDVPINVEYDLSIDADAIFYEVYIRYSPIENPFAIDLYQSTAEDNRVDKTSYLTFVKTLQGTLRDACDIVNPTISIAQGDIPTFNYVYIPTFGRYYFVDAFESVRFGLWRITLRCDVLMTYKTAISGLTALIGRQENDYNLELVDTKLPLQQNYTVTVEDIQNTGLDAHTVGVLGGFPFVLCSVQG